jgi:hypothetical protein
MQEIDGAVDDFVITADGSIVAGLENGNVLELSPDLRKEWEIKLSDAEVTIAGVDDNDKFYLDLYDVELGRSEPTVVLGIPR